MFHFSLISYRYNFRSSHRRCSLKKSILKNFANFTGKHMSWRLFLIRLQAWGLKLYWKETATQMLSCKICEILKNIYFEERLRTTVTVISKSWMHSFIQICLCQKNIRTIAPEKNWSPVRVWVWVRVRVSLGIISLIVYLILLIVYLFVNTHPSEVGY